MIQILLAFTLALSPVPGGDRYDCPRLFDDRSESDAGSIYFSEAIQTEELASVLAYLDSLPDMERLGDPVVECRDKAGRATWMRVWFRVHQTTVPADRLD